MNPFEYLLLFAAIVMGLAISDLAISLHRLLNAAGRVRWGLLSPLAAIVAFLKIVTQWWTWYSGQSLAGAFSFEMFIGVMIGAVLLYLIAAAALPEVAEGESIVDLSAYYDFVRRRFWLLFAAHWVVATSVSTWAQMQILGAHLNMRSPAYLIVPAAVALAFIKARWVHVLCMIALIVLYVVQLSGQHLVEH
jgi:hypothetical protein